ncbi:DUF2845 domain-containing protein [Burkholderia pseudomallei]|uniref:DUF2845 domain-containing protein n=1 Tax=Burkholderia pseudomallei TaxID=28450 RepID=UPI00135E3E09|nr:DUF2845 domain-containing protein [Burkholderia pseudomallei]MWA29781.1 DUF2845 domain-containing protein [Burkholderia pseudomallei]
MSRYLVAALALLLTSVTVHAESSLRVGSKLLTRGDSAIKVQELMGQPALRAFADSQSGGLPKNQVASGEQWQYAMDGKTIVITIVGGKVANIETLYR